MFADICGKPMTAYPPDPGADHLYAHHERVGEEYCPQHVEAKLRAGLRIGRNAAGVVVRRASDQSRPKFPKP